MLCLLSLLAPLAAGARPPFFTQWWYTVYAASGGANRPQITGPGLDGGGFHC